VPKGDADFDPTGASAPGAPPMTGVAFNEIGMLTVNLNAPPKPMSKA